MLKINPMTHHIIDGRASMNPPARRIAAILFLACAGLTVGHVMVWLT